MNNKTVNKKHIDTKCLLRYSSGMGEGMLRVETFLKRGLSCVENKDGNISVVIGEGKQVNVPYKTHLLSLKNPLDLDIGELIELLNKFVNLLKQEYK